MGSYTSLKCLVAAAVTLCGLRLSHFDFLSTRTRLLLCLLGAYLPSFLDGAECQPAPRRSAAVSSILQSLARLTLPYFLDIRTKLEDPAALSAAKQCIFAVHPHGVLSLGHYLFVLAFDSALEWASPPSRRSALSAGVLFKIPIFRELALGLGCVSAAREVAVKCLRAGLSLSVVPGGEREQLLAQRGPRELLVLKSRQGFVRLALQHGVPLVPTYVFGEAQLYHQSALFFGFRSWLQRRLGVALVMPSGPFGLPFVPFTASTPIRIVVGRPLELPRIAQPTQEDVDHHHKRYIVELEALFERNKAEAGYPSIYLELL